MTKKQLSGFLKLKRHTQVSVLPGPSCKGTYLLQHACFFIEVKWIVSNCRTDQRWEAKSVQWQDRLLPQVLMFNIETKVKTAYYLPTSTPPLIDLLILSAILVSRYFFSSATLPQTTTGLGLCRERKTEYLLAATRCRNMKSYHLVQTLFELYKILINLLRQINSSKSDHHQQWAMWYYIHQAMKWRLHVDHCDYLSCPPWLSTRRCGVKRGSGSWWARRGWGRSTGTSRRRLRGDCKEKLKKWTNNNKVDWEVKVLI